MSIINFSILTQIANLDEEKLDALYVGLRMAPPIDDLDEWFEEHRVFLNLVICRMAYLNARHAGHSHECAFAELQEMLTEAQLRAPSSGEVH